MEGIIAYLVDVFDFKTLGWFMCLAIASHDDVIEMSNPMFKAISQK